MPQDKRTGRKRLRTLPKRVQRLLSFGVFAASFEVPAERRAEEMVRGLGWFVDLLHQEGYAAPRWLLSPLWYFRRGLVLHDPERPTPYLMLGLLEGLVEELPEAEQVERMREWLYLARSIYAERGVEPPEWLLLGLDRYGEEEGEELPPDVMLDVVDASVLALPEETRPQARRSVLEFYAALYTSRGAPVPPWVRIGLEGA
jgi:hypothetical protein